MKQISHFVGLSGIGGVQRNFVEYLNYVCTNKPEFHHKIYTFGEVDEPYNLPVEVLDIRRIVNFLNLVLDIISKRKIVHFYNNLSSLKVAVLLLFIPVSKLIVHERGTAWNQSAKQWLVPNFIAWKATLILSNSVATKIMLNKKFSIPVRKIKVIHNGINTRCKNQYEGKIYHSKSIFNIGFIGRLDTPKGVHILIESMRYLTKENIKLSIAGDGPLESNLKEQAFNLCNVEFMGRFNNPYDFIQQIDLLVVPSIREPLGNVCMEAGLCKTPVLAANIDGIPEIIENRVSGELVDPTDDIAINIPVGAVALPEFVVDPVTHEITPPRQINPKHLANKILELSLEEEILTGYSEQLHKRVVDYFNIDRYALELHRIYQGM